MNFFYKYRNVVFCNKIRLNRKKIIKFCELVIVYKSCWRIPLYLINIETVASFKNIKKSSSCIQNSHTLYHMLRCKHFRIKCFIDVSLKIVKQLNFSLLLLILKHLLSDWNYIWTNLINIESRLTINFR